jgi:hypothetical protein
MRGNPYLPPQRRGSRFNLQTVVALCFGLFVLYAVGFNLIRAEIHGQGIGLVAWVLGIALVTLIVATGLFSWAIRRAIAMNGDGLQLLAQGNVGAARTLFETMAQSRVRSVRALARHNLASTLFAESKLELATAALIALHRSGDLARAPFLQSRSAAALAECYALAGNLDVAAQWLDEAERLKQRVDDPRSLAGQMRLIRAVIACRRGQPDDAARSLEAEWHALEQGLTGATLRPLRLVRAFALSLAGSPRDDGAVARQLDPLRDGRPGSLRYLTVAWPELAAFMDLHRL